MHEVALLAALYLEAQKRGTQFDAKQKETALRNLLIRMGYLRE